jgi:hypothetical protein
MDALHWVSIGILCVFCLELLLVAAAKGPLRFLRSPLDVLDLFIVASSTGICGIVRSK